MKSSVLDGKPRQKTAERRIPLPDVSETLTIENNLMHRVTPDLTRYRDQELVSRRTPDLTRHSDLEREYRTLKREMCVVTPVVSEFDTIAEDKSKELSDYGVKAVSGSRDDNLKALVTDKGRQFNSHDFLLSNNLAMDHFKKHIMNIKMNCRKHHKAVKQKSIKNKSSTDKIKTKFKPVFEQVD